MSEKKDRVSDGMKDQKQADHLENLAAEAYCAGDLQGAEALLKRASVLGEADSIWENLGMVRIGLQDFVGALQAYSQLARPDSGALLNRGLAFEHLEDAASARRDCRAALELTPENVDVLIILGTLELAEGENETARDLLERAATIDPRANWQLADVFRADDDLARPQPVCEWRSRRGRSGRSWSSQNSNRKAVGTILR